MTDEMSNIKQRKVMNQEIMRSLSVFERTFGLNGEYFLEDGWIDTGQKTKDGKRILKKENPNFVSTWYRSIK